MIEKMTDNEKLCVFCHSVLRTVTFGEGYPHHPNLQSLHGSSQAGCPLCAMVWESFSHLEIFPNLESNDAEQVSITFGLDDGRLDSSDEEASTLDGEPYFWFRLEYANDPMKGVFTNRISINVVPIEKNMTSYKANSNTGSNESWEVGLRWIQNCRANHSKCNAEIRENWLPDRVLDVGTLSQPSLRLHITSENSPRSPYVTLSHSWGLIEIKKLGVANLNQFIEGIDITELTKTFQDAINIARRLEIRFLWIDSLCIIQDSVEDWLKQSIVMGDIYQHSYCNIAATAAPDGRTGCFLERNPLLAQPFRVRIDSYPGPRSKSNIYSFAPTVFWERGLLKAPLLQRGWVVQERTLAPRVIHFGKGQLYWECHEMDACEMFPDGVPGTFLRGAYFGVGFKHLDPKSDGTKIRQSESGGMGQDHSWVLDPSTDAFYVWSGLLSEYTNCLLTKNSDKLIAVSAIARLFQPILNDEYVAGLWKRHIGQHLLWRLETPQKFTEPLTISETHQPPSWSWASVLGRVNPYSGIVRHDKPLMIKVLDIKAKNLTADTFGHVTSGCIKVRGWLKHFPPPKNVDDEDEDEDGDVTWQVDMPGSCFAYPDQTPFPNVDKWYLLPVLECTQKFDGKMEKKIFGLMLLETGRENEYRRIGSFDTLGDEALKLLTRPTYPFEKAPEGEGEGLDNVPLGTIKSKKIFGWPFQKNQWVESVINIV